MSTTSRYKSQLILFAMSLAVFLICVEYTGIVVAIPPMTKTLGLSLNALQWSVTGYLLSFSTIIIIGGRLGDIYGNRLILILGLFCFAIASSLAGFAQTAEQMILGRILQGIGAALVWPNTTAIAFNSAPSEKKALAIGIVTGVVGFAMAAGPLLAGYLASALSWRWFFFMNTPLSLLIILSTYYFVSEGKKESREKIDYAGFVLLVASLGALMLGMSQNKSYGTAAVLILAGLIFLKVLLAIENKISDPLIKPELFKNAIFMWGCLVRALTNLGFYVFLFIMGLYLHQNLGYSPLKSGMLFLPMTIIIGILSPIGGKIIDRYGAIWPTIIGIVLSIITYLIFTFSFQAFEHSALGLGLAFTLPGIAYGIVSPGLLTLTMRATDPKNSGAASGIFYMASLLGSSMGVAFATLLMHFHQNNLEKSLLTIMLMCAIGVSLGLWITLKYLKNQLA